MIHKYRYEAISAEIEKNILEGRFKPGHRLPSVRELKKKYNIGVSTVQDAYEYLIIKGLVESIPKSGYYVAVNKGDQTGNSQSATNAFLKPDKALVRDAVFKNNLSVITANTDRNKKHQLNEFNVAAPGDLFVPQKLILRTMQQVIREKGTELLRYYPPNGSEFLREHITKRAVLYDTALNADELIITDGALQALYIALASVSSPGDVIAIESPCVFSVLEVLRTLKLKVVEVPVNPIYGFDVDFLKSVVENTLIKAIVLTPNFHNPTGAILSDDHKKELLDIALKREIAIIENDVYGDLNFLGNRPNNIKSIDTSGLVMTFSSYSKTLASGIRLGWLSPGRFFKQAEQVKFSLGSTVAPIYQETMAKLLSSSSYDGHVRKFRMKLAAQSFHTINLIAEYFPSETWFSKPKGGYSIWVKMDEKVNMKQFYQQCEQIGVRFTPGSTFSFSKAFDHHFRIVFANQYTAQREEVLMKIGEVAKALIIQI